MARKLLTKKQREINFKKTQAKYRAKAKKTRVLIPQFRITQMENITFAVPAFKKFKSKKEAMVLGLRLVAVLTKEEVSSILNK